MRMEHTAMAYQGNCIKEPLKYADSMYFFYIGRWKKNYSENDLHFLFFSSV